MKLKLIKLGLIIYFLFLASCSIVREGLFSVFTSSNSENYVYRYNSEIEGGDRRNGIEQVNLHKTDGGVSKISFIAYGTLEGMASLTRNILVYMNSDIVDYTLIYDNRSGEYVDRHTGYRYYYKEGSCKGRCEEFAVIIKEAQLGGINNINSNNLSGGGPPSVQIIPAVQIDVLSIGGGSDNRMRQFYFEISKYVRTSNIYPYSDRTGISSHIMVKDIEFRTTALPGDVATWSVEVLNQMGFYNNILVNKSHVGFFSIQFGKSACRDLYKIYKKENEKNKNKIYRYEYIKSNFLKDDNINNCFDFNIEIFSKNKDTIVQFTSIIKSPVAMEYYNRISAIIKTYSFASF